MLDNFQEIYNKELEQFYGHIGGLSHLILDSEEVRSFVYEICKNCIAFQMLNVSCKEKQCIAKFVVK